MTTRLHRGTDKLSPISVILVYILSLHQINYWLSSHGLQENVTFASFLVRQVCRKLFSFYKYGGDNEAWLLGSINY